MQRPTDIEPTGSEPTDIEKDFEKILQTNLGLPADRSLDHDTPLADYGLDSLTAVNIVVDLEQRFAVTFPDDRIMFAMFHSARTLWNALSELIA